MGPKHMLRVSHVNSLLECGKLSRKKIKPPPFTDSASGFIIQVININYCATNKHDKAYLS